MTLYEDINYGGAKYVFLEDKPEFDSIGWDNRASSIKVPPGCAAVLYVDPNYGGNPYRFTSDTPNFVDIGWNDEASSIQVSANSNSCAVTLYEDINYGGAKYVFLEDKPEFDSIGWDNRASSIKVPPGCTAVLYVDPNYGGNSYRFTSDNPNLLDIGWNDEASSIQVGGKLASSVPVYRLYNASTGQHFYTISGSERDQAIATGYASEGIGFWVPSQWDPSAVPVFRLYRSSTGGYLYTTDASERDYAVANYGYTSQGISFYAFWWNGSSCSLGTVNVYRLYKSATDDHFYTTNSNERDQAISNSGYQDETTEFCAVPFGSTLGSGDPAVVLAVTGGKVIGCGASNDCPTPREIGPYYVNEWLHLEVDWAGTAIGQNAMYSLVCDSPNLVSSGGGTRNSCAGTEIFRSATSNTLNPEIWYVPLWPTHVSWYGFVCSSSPNYCSVNSYHFDYDVIQGSPPPFPETGGAAVLAVTGGKVIGCGQSPDPCANPRQSPPYYVNEWLQLEVDWAGAAAGGNSMYSMVCDSPNLVDYGGGTHNRCAGNLIFTSWTSNFSNPQIWYIPIAAGHVSWYGFICSVSPNYCSLNSYHFDYDVSQESGTADAPTINSASATPASSNFGDLVNFTVNWTDIDSADQHVVIICKTNFVSAGGSDGADCPGGVWTASDMSSAASPTTIDYSTYDADVGTQTYYAFVCDQTSLCSPGVSGTFTVVNASPSLTAISASPNPVAVGGSIQFDATWTDPNSADQEQAVICKTKSVSSGTCPGGAWAIGDFAASAEAATVGQASASYTAQSADIGTRAYYAFVCDMRGACSSSRSGTFTVQSNTNTPAITSAEADPNPAYAGEEVDFEIGWTDSDPGENIKPVICKTNAIIDGTCTGGSWAIGSSVTAVPAVAAYTTTLSDVGAHAFFAFACDSQNHCTASIPGTFAVIDVPAPMDPDQWQAAGSPTGPIDLQNPATYGLTVQEGKQAAAANPEDVTGAAGAADPPPTSISRYVTVGGMWANRPSSFYRVGYREPTGDIAAIVGFGGVCSGNGFTVFSRPPNRICPSVFGNDGIAHNVDDWLRGYFRNPDHKGSGTVTLIIGTNNSFSRDRAELRTNAANLYDALSNDTYKYAQSLNGRADDMNLGFSFFVAAGNDIEVGFGNVASARPWVRKWNDKATASATNSEPYMRMFNYGGYNNNCTSKSCWDTQYTNHWTPHLIYDMSWGVGDQGYAADFAFPEMYTSTHADEWHDLNLAAVDRGNGYNRIPWSGVLDTCGDKSLEFNNKPREAYNSTARYQRPRWLSLIIALSGTC